MVKIFILLCTSAIFASCATQQTITEQPKTVDASPTETLGDSANFSENILIKRVWNADEISEYITSKNGQITGCYESLKLKKSSASGSLVVRFRVIPSGTIDSFLVVSDAIRDENLIRCVRHNIMKWKFESVDASNQPIWLEVPYDFTDFYPSNQKLRSEEECSDVISQNKNQLRACFAEYDQSAELTIEVVILPNGKVERVSFTNSSISGSEIEDCLTKKIERWVFSKLSSDDVQILKFSYIYSK